MSTRENELYCNKFRQKRPTCKYVVMFCLNSLMVPSPSQIWAVPASHLRFLDFPLPMPRALQRKEEKTHRHIRKER